MLETLGTPNPAQCPRWSTCLDLPRDLVLEMLSCFNLLGDLLVQGSQEVDMPRPAQGRNSREAHLPQPDQGFNLQETITGQPAWDLYCDLGMPGSQVATVLSRIIFRKTHP